MAELTDVEIAQLHTSALISASIVLTNFVLDGTDASSANAGSSLLLEDGEKVLMNGCVKHSRGEPVETDAEAAARITRNIETLSTIKAYKREDGTTSIWTSEDFTVINKAIAS